MKFKKHIIASILIACSCITFTSLSAQVVTVNSATKKNMHQYLVKLKYIDASSGRNVNFTTNVNAKNKKEAKKIIRKRFIKIARKGTLKILRIK